MTRIGIVGGTFDPIHNGHVALIRAAAQSGRLDRIIVLPAGIPPHNYKSIEKTAFAAYRFVMVQKALEGIPGVEVSNLEILRQGNSYTIDTVKALRKSGSPDDEIVLIYGSDIIADMHKWKQPGQLLKAAGLFLARRGGDTPAAVQQQAERLKQDYGARIEFFDAPEIKLSSTEVRAAIAAGKPLDHMLPESVIRFIRKHDLYQPDEAVWTLPSDVKLQLRRFERELWPLLTMKRLLHSLNVCRLSVRLAAAHGLPLEPAAIAGILHDCAKDLPVPEILRLAEQAGDPLLMQPAIAHGPAGAVLASRDFGVSDPAIRHAIQCHTTGCIDMNDLDRIIFIADKVEPARTYQNLDEIRRLAPTNLNAAMRICLDEISLFLEREGIPAHPYAAAAYDSTYNQL